MKPRTDSEIPELHSGESAPAPRESVSATLRRRRKELGQDLKSVAETLRIRYAYLEAIEQGRFDALPGPTYALGFIKTYAEFLDLDEDEIAQRFRQDVDGLDDQTQLVFPSPVPEGKVPGGAILLVAVLMGSMAYGGWHYLSNQDAGFADFIPALPDRLQALFQSDSENSVVSEIAAVLGTESTEPAEPLNEAAVRSGSDVPESAPQATVAATSDSVAEPASESGQPGAVAAENPAENPVENLAENPGSGGALEADRQAPALTQTPETAQTQASTGAALRADAGAAVPVEPNDAVQVTSLSASGDTGQRAEEPAVRNQTVGATTPVTDTSAEAARGQASVESEIPAAPAAPMATQTVSVPDATQPQVYGENNADARIVLRATQDSWVQVRDSEDELLLTRVLREGDVYRVPNQQGLTLLTGNAGGIDVLVDGTLLAPLGPVGSVRRDLALDPQALLNGATSRE